MSTDSIEAPSTRMRFVTFFKIPQIPFAKQSFTSRRLCFNFFRCLLIELSATLQCQLSMLRHRIRKPLSFERLYLDERPNHSHKMTFGFVCSPYPPPPSSTPPFLI